MVSTAESKRTESTAAGEAIPKDPRVTEAEVARDLVKLDLERRQFERSIADLGKPKTDLNLGVLPKTTAKTATVDDNGGGASAALESAKAVAAQAIVIATSVAAATTGAHTIVLLDERTVSDQSIGAADLGRRAKALAEVLATVVGTAAHLVTRRVAGNDEADGGEGDGDEPAGVAAADEDAGAAAVGAAVPPGMQFLGLALGFVDAIAPSVALHGRAIDLPDQSLRDAVAGALAHGQRTVIVPSMVSASESDLYDDVIALAKRSEEARRAVRRAQRENASEDLRVAEIDTAIAQAEAARVKAVTGGDDAAERRLTAFIETSVERRTTITATLVRRSREAFIGDVTTAVTAAEAFLALVLSSSNGTSMLQRAAVSEKVLRTDRANRRFLHVDITMMGGDVLTTSSFTGSELKVKGVAQTTYLLTDAEGKVVASGSHQGDAGDPLKVEQPFKAQLALIAIVTLALIAAVTVIGLVLRLVGIAT